MLTVETTPATMRNFNEVSEYGSDWRYSAICKHAPDCYQAFIKTPKKTYSIGVFASKQEAERAIADAEGAVWNG